MMWGKFVLFFQAIVTFFIGVAFLVTLFVGSGFSAESLKDRYSAASYILINVSLIELIILMRLFD